MRQLLDGCRDLLQRLAARLEFGLELRPVGRRQLVVFITAFKLLDDYLGRCSAWDNK